MVEQIRDQATLKVFQKRRERVLVQQSTGDYPAFEPFETLFHKKAGAGR